MTSLRRIETLQSKHAVVHIVKDATGTTPGGDSVLQGLLTSSVYLNHTSRSVIIGPCLATDDSADQRLGPYGEVVYSSLDGLTPEPFARAFGSVERKFGVAIVYGRRTFNNHCSVPSRIETILIDVSKAVLEPINAFKAWLYDDFGIASIRYENDPVYDLSARFAPAAVASLRAMGVATPEHPALLVAHGHLAIPAALAGIMDPLGSFKTVYYADDVPAVRDIVESHPGHDTMFLNALKWSRSYDYYLDEVFGSHNDAFENALTRAGSFCDNIVAPSDRVVRELRFLGHCFDERPLGVAYHGLPSQSISLAQKRSAKAKLQQYAANLLDYRPDYVFTHVSRMSTSKAFWRDLTVLHHLEDNFRRRGTTGVLFVLSTDAPPRPPDAVRYMEENWGWPLEHKIDPLDLTAAEQLFYQSVHCFNTNHIRVKVVLVNQFGWDAGACGLRMPHDMVRSDLAYGTDAEFGQSMYDPFGVAHVEPLPFGALCVIGSACGCNDFIRTRTGAALPPNIIIADYGDLDKHPHTNDRDAQQSRTLRNILAIDQAQRDIVEHRVARQIADILIERLPRDDRQSQKLLASGHALAEQMNWDNACRDYLLPALDRAFRHHRVARSIA